MTHDETQLQLIRLIDVLDKLHDFGPAPLENFVWARWDPSIQQTNWCQYKDDLTEFYKFAYDVYIKIHEDTTVEITFKGLWYKWAADYG